VPGRPLLPLYLLGRLSHGEGLLACQFHRMHFFGMLLHLGDQRVLVLRAVPRDELGEAVWPGEQPL
jgi:hypothetical protein